MMRALENLSQDLWFGARMLAKNPGFTAVVVLTLALGTGASTAIYSVVNTVLLNPVPGSAPTRLMEIVERQAYGVSAEVLAALMAKTEFFADFAWFRDLVLRTRTDELNDEVRGDIVSPNFFAFWNVRPLLGRTFAKDEAVPINAQNIPERDSVIVLNHSWWKSRFAGDAGVLGQTIELGGRRFTVIGVMPPHFQYPRGWYLSFWVPAEDPRPSSNGRSADFSLLVRLKPGIGKDQTQAMLDITARQLLRDRGLDNSDSSGPLRPKSHSFGLTLHPGSDRFTTGYRTADDLPRTLYGLLAAIGFVLLIVCLNVANLTLARTERRQQELAIRTALGAGRGRLASQLVVEAVLLTCLGGVAGLAVTVGCLKLLLWLIPPNMPRLKAIDLDGYALGFALLLSAITGVAFGLASAWHSSRTRLNETLKQAGAGATAGRNRSLYRSALVVIEVALSLVLLAGAGLMVQSVARLLRINPGFDPENLLYVNLWLPAKYSDTDGAPTARQLRNALFDRLKERLTALPGVKAVGIFGGDPGARKIKTAEGGEPVVVAGIGCGLEQGDYLRALRIPLRAGRYFDQQDRGERSGAVIINESMARLCWPGGNALGRTFRAADSPDGLVYQVVGIVADVRPVRYTQRVGPAYYGPCYAAEFGGDNPSLLFVVRTERDPHGLVPALLRELKASEPDMIHPRIIVARQSLDDSTQVQRTYMLYLVGFAAVALLLAALGIYGVLAYSVARRTREMGIRLAVGSRRRDVLALVMWEGTRLVGLGAGLGLLGAFWLLQLVKHLIFQVNWTSSMEEGPLSQLLKYQLFQAGPMNLLVWAGAVSLLLAVALLACLLPALRAARVDPMTALRCE